MLKLCLVVGLLVAPPALVNCVATEPRGSVASPAVSTEVATAFASARVALGLLDAAEVYRLDSLAHPTDDELKASADRVAKLQAVRAVLERVRQHLSGDVKNDLHQALADLELLASSARSSGIKLPPEVASSIAAAKAVLP